MEKFSPKVSVIIPVYNAEKFLGVCLESLLIQTLTDFEVIVVDDCSTDSSMAIAKSYVERFGGRLKIFTLPQNSGSGAVPRNVGLEHARGEYVYFVDDDDLIINNALETLYNFAQSYRADVVYMEKFFTCDEEPVPSTLNPSEWQAILADDASPAFESDNIAARVKKFINSRFWCAPWAKFLRRKFLGDNHITLPPMKIADDVIWTFKIVCLAKKFLRVPARLYVNRDNGTSVTQTKRSPAEVVSFWTNPLIIGVELLDEFMRSLDFFRQNSNARLHVLNYFMNVKFNFMADALKVLDATEVYEIFLREFSKADSTQPALIAYLLTMNNLYRSEMMK